MVASLYPDPSTALRNSPTTSIGCSAGVPQARIAAAARARARSGLRLENSAVVAIETLEVLEGELPGRAYRMVLEWAVERRPELRANWQLARDHLPLEPIEPLR